MLIRVLWVGRGRDRLLAEPAARYVERLRKLGSLRAERVPPATSGDATSDRRLEAQRLRAALEARGGAASKGGLPASHALVALDEHGELVTSRGLHDLLEGFARQGKQQVSFVVGGDDGLDAGFVAGADRVLALSRMTLTHEMARLLLLEQLYRAETMRRGHPYHRD